MPHPTEPQRAPPPTGIRVGFAANSSEKNVKEKIYRSVYISQPNYLCACELTPSKF